MFENGLTSLIWKVLAPDRISNVKQLITLQ
jgi:hypothetical protein